jgi:acetyl esterase/lipase
MRALSLLPLCAAAILALALDPLAVQAQDLLSAGDVVAMESPAPEHVIRYGGDPLQFGHLRLPEGEGPHPVVVFIHGGCWLSMFDIGHVGLLEEALTQEGYAVWSLEYRRVGDAGGGWPGTFQDVGAGADHLRVLADRFQLDLERVIVAGHSAGAQFALWIAARGRIPRESELWVEEPLPVKGVLALAPAADLEGLHTAGVCGNVIDGLMGGSPEAVPDRYAAASPMQLAPIGVPQTLVVGAHDSSWGPGGQVYLESARGAGDDSVVLMEAPESGHFEMIVPSTSSWWVVTQALGDLARRVGVD